MRNTPLFLVLVLIAVGLEVVSDILFKKWSIDSRTPFLIIGMIIYTIGTGIWAFSLRYESLSKAIAVFTILNLVIVVLAGLVIFHETLTTRQKIGIALGIISVALIEF